MIQKNHHHCHGYDKIINAKLNIQDMKRTEATISTLR